MLKLPEGYAPAPVVSLSIFRAESAPNGVISEASEILAVVRHPEFNLTHPNVLSVPTQRLPASLFHSLLHSSLIVEEQPSTTFYESELVDSRTANGHDPVIYTVESMLARKLGVAEALEQNRLHFRAALRQMTIGEAYYLNLPPGQDAEEIAMANIVVFITEGWDLFPAATSSYSRIVCARVDQFLSTVLERDPDRLQADLDPIDICVHGLCLYTSYNVIARDLHLNLHPGFHREHLSPAGAGPFDHGSS